MALKRLNDQLSIALISASILTAGWISSASLNSVSLFGIGVPALCPFRLLSSWDCPGCGLTRSLVLALHGDWSGSYTMHIWGIPLLLLLLFQIPYRIFRYLKPDNAVPRLPEAVQKWVSPAIFLSLLMPWAFKTIALAVVRYL